MPIKVNSNGKVITKEGKISCECCELFEMRILYDWSGTNQIDLDTGTTAFGATVGYACGSGNQYIAWISGDDTSQNGFESVDVRVDAAKADGLWTSSYNISCAAGWYEPVGGSGSYTLRVTYKGDTKSLLSSAGSQDDCATYPSRTVTVYSSQQSDGTYFEIL